MLFKEVQDLSKEVAKAIENHDQSNANGLKKELKDKRIEIEEDDTKEYAFRPEDPLSPTISKKEVLQIIDEDIKNITHFRTHLPKP